MIYNYPTKSPLEDIEAEIIRTREMFVSNPNQEAAIRDLLKNFHYVYIVTCYMDVMKNSEKGSVICTTTHYSNNYPLSYEELKDIKTYILKKSSLVLETNVLTHTLLSCIPVQIDKYLYWKEVKANPKATRDSKHYKYACSITYYVEVIAMDDSGRKYMDKSLIERTIYTDNYPLHFEEFKNAEEECLKVALNYGKIETVSCVLVNCTPTQIG